MSNFKNRYNGSGKGCRCRKGVILENPNRPVTNWPISIQLPSPARAHSKCQAVRPISLRRFPVKVARSSPTVMSMILASRQNVILLPACANHSKEPIEVVAGKLLLHSTARARTMQLTRPWFSRTWRYWLGIRSIPD